MTNNDKLSKLFTQILKLEDKIDFYINTNCKNEIEEIKTEIKKIKKEYNLLIQNILKL